MAQAPQSPGGNDNFIRRIVTDPKNVPDVMLLTGYLGASSEEAHERLYLSSDLSNYVEIPKDAILHQAPLPKEQDAHGGVTLWVRKDAALQYKMAPAAQALANYFAGAIQAGAQGVAPAAQPMPATLGGPVCGTIVCPPPGPPPAQTAFCFTRVACITPHPPCYVLATGNAPGCATRFWHCTQPPYCLVSGLGTCPVNGCTAVFGNCPHIPGQSPFAQPCAHAAAFAGPPQELQALALQQPFGGGNVSGGFCHQPTIHCSRYELVCGHTQWFNPACQPPGL
jgi:hypothetical protein